MQLVDYEREYFIDSTQKDRLSQKSTNSINFTIVKEILDNAADEVERNQSNYIEISFNNYVFSVLNKGVIKEKEIKSITSFKTLYSKKYKFKRISRGMVGHGLKLAIMLSYQEDEKNVFKIHTDGKLYEIYLNDRTPKNPNNVLKVVAKETDVEKEYTKIEVKLSYRMYKNDSIDFDNIFFLDKKIEKDVYDFIYSFIAGNPHITFKLEIENEKKLFEKTTNMKIIKKADIKAYSPGEFKDFIGIKKEKLLHRISKSSFKELFSEFNLPTNKINNNLKFKTIDEIYNFIKDNAKKFAMPIFGKKAIEIRLNEVFENFVSYGYESFRNDNFSSEIILFKTDTKISSYRYGTIIPIINGTYFTSAINGYEIEEKLKNDNLFVFLMCYGTNLDISGNNKENFHVPSEIIALIKQLHKDFKNSKTNKKPEKEHYSWLKKANEYKYLIKTKSQNVLYQTLHSEIDKDSIKNTIEVKHIFLSDCMEIIYKIIEEFGPISVRTAYYHVLSHQLIERDSYDKFDKLLTDARKEGLISWKIFMDDSKPFISDGYAISLDKDVVEYIEENILSSLKEPYNFNIWEKQKIRIEVWVEKTALFPFIKDITTKYNIFLQSLRGYSSITKAKEGIERMKHYLNKGYKVKLFYIGDFDPTGWNISRVLEEEYFKKEIDNNRFSLERLALNFEQIANEGDENFLVSKEPLPISEKDNNAKRFEEIFKSKFEEKNIPFGGYEVEAIKPAKLRELLENAIKSFMEHEVYIESVESWLNEFTEIKNHIKKELELIFNKLKLQKIDKNSNFS